MGSVYVYEAGAQDFDSIGLVGALTPIESTHEEIANGLSELTLVHPIDDWGRYAELIADRVIKARVPVRTCPEIVNGNLVTSLERWRVKSSATLAQRVLYSKASGGSRVLDLNLGENVLVTIKDDSKARYKIISGLVRTASRFGVGMDGWIDKNAIEYLDTIEVPATTSGIESAAPTWSARDQLFRITDVSKSDEEGTVTITALHIFYDLLGNLTNFKMVEMVDGQVALDMILGNCLVANDFEAFTDINGSRAGVDWTRVNPVNALLDEENGFCKRWDAQIIRNNWSIYCLSSAGMDRGVRIEYAKNLTGVDCSENIENLITRIVPVGRTKAGAELLLDGTIWVDSPNIGKYRSPHIYYLECTDCTVGTNGVTTAIARARMREQAQAMFDAGCDVPEIKVSVRFVELGDTEEYAQYHGLDQVRLYDTVTVYHPKLGIDVKAEVVRICWDSLGEHVTEIELGSARGTLSSNTYAQAQMESKLRSASTSADAALILANTANEQTMQVVIESSAGSVLQHINTNITTVLQARVYFGGAEVTDAIDASRFIWSRESGDDAADGAWDLAHIGMKSVTASAAEFASARTIYRCTITDETEE